MSFVHYYDKVQPSSQTLSVSSLDLLQAYISGACMEMNYAASLTYGM